MKYDHLLPKKLTLNSLAIVGTTLAGIGTCLTLPQYKLCFDVAQGLPFAFSAKKFFITHAHMDHASGIPYVISQRAVQGLETSVFYMPESLVEPLTQIMNLWSGVEKHEYNFEFIGINENSKIKINKGMYVRAFDSFHRVPSFGYTLFEHHKKLKVEYQNLTSQQLIDLKKKNFEIHEYEETPIFTYTGDAKIEFLDSKPWVRKSKILAMEVTYFGKNKTVDNARDWGHIHLDELYEAINKIESEHILLVHLSARFKISEFISEIKRRFKRADVERITVFPRKYS